MSELLSTTVAAGLVTSVTTVVSTSSSTQVDPNLAQSNNAEQASTSTGTLTGSPTPFAPITVITTPGPPSNDGSGTGATLSTGVTNSTAGSSTSLTTSSTASIAIKHSKGVATGTVVGVGLGTALAGIFLTLLGVWLFLHRPSRSRPGNSSLIFGHSDRRFGRAERSIGKGASVAVTALEDISLDPVDDSQIRKTMQDLYELIYQHTENHYNGQKFEGRHEDLRHELGKGGWNDQTEPSARTLASLLVNPVTRHVAIRHIIAWTIIRHIDLKSRADRSLLPAYLVASSQALLNIRRNPGEQETFSISFPKWRHLTATLMSPLSSRNDNTEWDSMVSPGVTRSVEVLNGMLRPFRKSGKVAQLSQSDNLASVIFEGAHFGYLLFSHPATWIFRWDQKDPVPCSGNDRKVRSGIGNYSAERFLIVFPSIEKLIIRDGSDRSRVVVDAVLEQI